LFRAARQKGDGTPGIPEIAAVTQLDSQGGGQFPFFGGDLGTQWSMNKRRARSIEVVHVRRESAPFPVSRCSERSVTRLEAVCRDDLPIEVRAGHPSVVRSVTEGVNGT
jgi:hypothetical protein